MTVTQISSRVVRSHPELVAEYAAETRIPGMALPEPQWHVYDALETSGLYVIFGLYAGDELAGFSGVLTAVNPHHGVRIATVESLFVSKAYRSSTGAVRLMRAIEDHAQAVGCVDVLYSARAGSRLERTFAKRHTRTNSVFCISLRGDAGGTGRRVRGGGPDPEGPASRD